MDYTANKFLSTETVEILRQFRDVYVCDSSIISLPDKLEGQHKGLGGTKYSRLVYTVYLQSRELISFMRFFKVLREKITNLITLLTALTLDKYALISLFSDVIQKSKLEKRKRKTTEQKMMDHDLPEVVLQMLV